MRIHTLTIKRASETRGVLGGVRTTYTTAARSTLPTSVAGRAIAMSAKEKIDLGIRAEQFGWKFLTDTDPQITLEDQVSFDYVSGDTRTVKVTVPSRARIGTSLTPHHWVTFGTEDNTET